LSTIIFANGRLDTPPAISPGDVIIAADGGALHCLRLGIHPHVVIGDLDSLEAATQQQLREMGSSLIVFPARKDFTDLELALSYAKDNGLWEVVIAGALGQRWDMTLANLLLPVRFPELDIRMVDGPQELFLVRSGQTRQARGRPGDTVSLIPITDDVQGVNTQGLEYPLNDEPLLYGATRGVSNLLVGEEAQISLRQGALICVVIRK
jgi:thiamine pyrophosphokinase